MDVTHVDRVQLGPQAEMSTLLLAGQQVQLRNQPAGGKTPGQKRPRLQPASLGDPVSDRSGHPQFDVGVGAQQLLGAATAQVLRLAAAGQASEEGVVLGVQPPRIKRRPSGASMTG